jgi:hypothetical protein
MEPVQTDKMGMNGGSVKEWTKGRKVQEEIKQGERDSKGD